MKKYVINSHNRCEDFGIEKTRTISKKILTKPELKKRLKKESKFIEVAEPFLNHLYNFVKGSEFFAVLTDKQGCILSMVGDDDILKNAYHHEMVPGAFMDEKNIGTNAMGTALAEMAPVQISGKEHYIRAYHQWTCSGAPVKDVSGEIIGCLDLTGMSTNVHPHTLGMVVAAANAIERILEGLAYSNKLSDAKIYTETIINSIPTAIMTVDLEGKIISHNTAVSKTLGFSDDEFNFLKMHQIMPDYENILTLLKNKKSIVDEEMQVLSKFNKVLFAVSCYPIEDQFGIISHMVFIFKDVKKMRKLANKIMGRRAIYTFDKIIGDNDQFLSAVDFAKKIADSKSTVLITGESGTGKEIFAQAIQNHSNRSEEPFVAINCGAIPKNLIESELFGYEEGAFTGAKTSGQAGKFEIADGGTIFLDEIGEMPLDLQTRLLRVIEESIVSRIGSNTEMPVNVRIIAATNKDLKEEVNKGNFRKDLFYRLNVLPIHLPSLKERYNDIPALVEYFMTRISKKLNKNQVDIPESYMTYLKSYTWPGNIRELENLVELIINTETIPAYGAVKEMSVVKASKSVIPALVSLEVLEKKHIACVLLHYNYNVTLAAKCLGIGRNTLYRKLEKYNIDCSIIEQRSKTEQSN